MLQPIDGQPKEYGQDSHSSGVLPGSGERSDTGAIPGPQVVSDNHRLDMVLKCLQNCTQSGIYVAMQLFSICRLPSSWLRHSHVSPLLLSMTHVSAHTRLFPHVRAADCSALSLSLSLQLCSAVHLSN